MHEESFRASKTFCDHCQISRDPVTTRLKHGNLTISTGIFSFTELGKYKPVLCFAQSKQEWLTPKLHVNTTDVCQSQILMADLQPWLISHRKIIL